MVPVTNGQRRGMPHSGQATCLPRPRPPRSEIESGHSGIYFGERPSRTVVVGAQQDEFDYPTEIATRSGSIGTQTRWYGTTGIKLQTTT